jgi:1,4-dihydroxy-6-naphthoate synthase
MAARKKSSKKRAAPKKTAGSRAPSGRKAPAKKKAASTKKAAAKKKTSSRKKTTAKKKAASKKKAGAKKKSAAKAPVARKPALSASAAVAAALAAAELEEETEEHPSPEALPPMPPMPARRADGRISLAYGAESDQAFMVYALAAGLVDTEDREYELVRAERQELERTASKVPYDLMPIGFGAYPALRDRYLLLACGGAYGDYQGPILVARRPIRSEEVEGLEVGVPGERSAATLALRLWLPKSTLALRAMPTREISLRVRANHVRAGLLVNEDVVTYRNHNLVRVVDLGHWWGERTEGLPLALHAHAIRRDIPPALRGKIALDLKRSIAYALGHREDALDWAMQFAGRNTREVLDRYVTRTVNDLSLDCGERGRQAVRKLYEEGSRHGFLERPVEPVYHGDELAESGD